MKEIMIFVITQIIIRCTLGSPSVFGIHDLSHGKSSESLVLIAKTKSM